MIVGPRKKDAIAERRANVARLYRSGDSFSLIAEKLDIERKTVWSDMSAIRSDWRTSAISSYADGLTQELNKIDLMEEVAWAAWEKSCKKGKKRTTRTRSIEGGTEGNPAKVIESVITEEDLNGNEAYLRRIAWCIEQRCRLLGYVGTKVLPPGSLPGNEASDETGEPIEPEPQQPLVLAQVQLNQITVASEAQLKAIDAMLQAFPK